MDEGRIAELFDRLLNRSSHCMVQDGTGAYHDGIKAKRSDIEALRSELEGRGGQTVMRVWNYRTDPPANGDARKLVTLSENGMVWIGLRAWNFQGRYWQNGGEPEQSRAIAWAHLPSIAGGFWVSGNFIDHKKDAADLFEEVTPPQGGVDFVMGPRDDEGTRDCTCSTYPHHPSCGLASPPPSAAAMTLTAEQVQELRQRETRADGTPYVMWYDFQTLCKQADAAITLRAQLTAAEERERAAYEAAARTAESFLGRCPRRAPRTDGDGFLSACDASERDGWRGACHRIVDAIRSLAKETP